MEGARNFPIGDFTITVGPKIRDCEGKGPLFTPGLSLTHWYEYGLGMLKNLWSSDGVGMCAIRIDNIIELAKQSGQDDEYCGRLKQGLNHLSSSAGWLDPVEGHDGWFVPGRYMQGSML